MSIHRAAGNYQGQPEEYQRLSDLIEKETGLTSFSILVKPNCVSIRTQDYASYILARKAIRSHTNLEVVRDA